MNFLFRVDAGDVLGLGNFFRSLSLAENLKVLGHFVIFCFKDSNFWNNLRERNEISFFSFCINDNSQIELIINYNIDVFYVDGNVEFSKDSVLEIKKYCKVIFYQNLTPSRQYSDIFIYPSLNNSYAFFSIFPISTKIFKGLEFCLFNAEVYKLRPYKFNPKIKKIGIIAGGSDPFNCLEKIFHLIDFYNNSYLNSFLFFKGKDNIGCLDSIQYFIDCHDKYEGNLEILNFDHNEVLSCSFLISVFGVSTYEFLALKMPVISVAHNEQTLITLNNFDKFTNALYNLGHIDRLEKGIFHDLIFKLSDCDNELREMSNRAGKVFDFQGINRVTNILLYE